MLRQCLNEIIFKNLDVLHCGKINYKRRFGLLSIVGVNVWEINKELVIYSDAKVDITLSTFASLYIYFQYIYSDKGLYSET